MTRFQLLFCLLLILCYLQRMRLYPVVFDIYHNKWVILNLFLITMFFSYKCTRQTFVLVRGLFHCGVCTSPTFVSLMFELSNLCSIRRLWIQRLYWYWISKPSWEHSWVPQLKFQANWSRGSWVMIRTYKQTDKQRLQLYI